MKFFVDTADVGEIRDLAACGLLDGVITNSSPFDVNREICAIVPGLVSAETVATDHNGLRAFLDDWARTGQSIL